MSTMRVRSGQKATARDRLNSLTGLRFVAAAAVLIYHISVSLLPRLGGLEGIRNSLLYLLGPSGVIVFFVLSGFVLTWVHRPGERLRDFWRRRMVKLFPAHVVVLVLVAALAVVAGVGLNPGSVASMLLLVHGWLPIQEILLDYTLNSPSWSLSSELFFYLLFPGLIVLVDRLPHSRLWATFGLVAAVSAVMPFVARLLPDQPTSYGEGSPPWWEEWFLYYFPPVRALDFLLGVLIARIVVCGRWPRLRLAGALLVAALGYLVASLLFGIYGSAVLIAAPAALVVAALATADLAGHSGRLASRPMVYLGELSFALYLVHWPVVAYGPIALVTTPWDATTTPVAALRDAALTVAVSLVLAVLLHHLVERPAMRRWAHNRGPVVAIPSARPSGSTS